MQTFPITFEYFFKAIFSKFLKGFKLLSIISTRKVSDVSSLFSATLQQKRKLHHESIEYIKI